ncbi:hypothetical protein [Sutterella megalosphaeroides]|uniref:Uncharacterized protein n=1 Tax=Sutterella megalosphaeroides TaxID=2494234 RepID=A0A2Z6ICT6_9BURK|nr:hypothetical protein [Sutterella megalosphaeroides]BBF22908.1 hypothetical protein SUTMEG_07990 [Sutterella megalosphaeroides]
MFEYAKELLEIHRTKTGRSTLGIVFGASGWQAAVLSRAAYWCALQEWEALGGLVSSLNRILTGADIAPDAKLCERVYIAHGAGVVIESGARLDPDVELLGSAFVARNVRVAAGTVLAHGVHVTEEAPQATAQAIETVKTDSDKVEVPVEAEKATEKAPEKSEEKPAEKPADKSPDRDAALKELARVVKEQNAVIQKLNANLKEAGGEAIPDEDLPKLNTRNLGLSVRRARHHRTKTKPAAEE